MLAGEVDRHRGETTEHPITYQAGFSGEYFMGVQTGWHRGNLGLSQSNAGLDHGPGRPSQSNCDLVSASVGRRHRGDPLEGCSATGIQADPLSGPVIDPDGDAYPAASRLQGDAVRSRRRARRLQDLNHAGSKINAHDVARKKIRPHQPVHRAPTSPAYVAQIHGEIF